MQIFLAGCWRDCAVLTVPDPSRGGITTLAHFEYDLDYAFEADSEPVSLTLPVDTRHHTLSAWPAFLYDLIPQGNGRSHLLGLLELGDGKAADFALLRNGAFNPIGRVRIREAVDYFAQHIARHVTQGMDHGWEMQQLLLRDDGFAERMMIQGMLAAGTTGVQGAAPKYLLTQDHAGLWHADGVLPDAQAAAHYIVKLPRAGGNIDKKILRNEAAYLRVARAMGLRVHGCIEHHHDMLFIPRFDRTVVQGQVRRHHQESAAALAGIIGYDFRPSQFQLLQALRRVVTDKLADTIEFLQRDVLNLAMRNTDNHGRNTAVQKIGGVVQLSPLFDFAPMYLDPEGITRAARWYHPESGRELPEWHDVIATLELADDERSAIRAHLAAFGHRLNNLETCMQEAGVDADIITHLQPGIVEQVRQLRTLETG
ncbi:type II toxin-antitoxin system HipA family toxin [Actimicrobium sp. CCI2.3]|uniref:type II toxin-antitoxin system HipA family toxin n=1 Tax=Actimicrobium sp. CCI2.3 TaxID=3048616 RepID=UPI002AB3A3AA|nr:HipA domain-containing protein [Actimicrobium sp. CCI2.3]MDY7575589.1 HipA domain-containing protein [Actimicrobium sp. CCI2.3]MEB0022853.1 HipA domain-containing protein [Actimicrobium sp. CCI2.3]